MIAVNNDEHFTTKNKRSRLISMNAHLGQILQPFRKEEG
jgi:hypothetical protein